MIIDEAIKILSNPVYEHYRTKEAHFPEANQLSIEALKHIKRGRRRRGNFVDNLLPGETLD